MRILLLLSMTVLPTLGDGYTALFLSANAQASWDFSPACGLRISGAKTEPFLLGPYAEAARQRTDAFRLMGVSRDGWLWVSAGQRSFPIGLWGWDGKAWHAAKIELDDPANAFTQSLKDGTSIHNSVRRVESDTDTLYFSDRWGVYAYEGEGRFSYATLISQSGLSGQDRSDEIQNWAQSGGTTFFTRNPKNSVARHDADGWTSAEPEQLPIDMHQLFGFENGTALGFGTGKAWHISLDGERTELELSRPMPVIRDARKRRILVKCYDGAWYWSIVDQDGAVTKMPWTVSDQQSTHRIQGRPVYHEDSVYWQTRGQLYEWDKDSLTSAVLVGPHMIGHDESGNLVFLRQGAAWSISFEALADQLKAPIPVAMTHQNIQRPHLDNEGYLRALLPRPDADVNRVRLHHKTEWQLCRYRDGDWQLREDEPSYVTYSCGLRWCQSCHTKPRLREQLPESFPMHKANAPLTLTAEGKLMVLKEGLWMPADPDAVTLTRSDGTRWVNTLAGLFEL